MSHEQEIGIDEVLAGPRKELSEAQVSGQVLKSAEKASRLYLKAVGVYLRDRHVGNKALGAVLAAATPIGLPFGVFTSSLEAALLYKKPKKKTE